MYLQDELSKRDIENAYITLQKRMSKGNITHYAPDTLCRYGKCISMPPIATWEELLDKINCTQDVNEKQKLTERYFMQDNCYDWLNNVILSKLNLIQLTPDNFCIEKIDIHDVFSDYENILNDSMIHEILLRLYELKICLDRLEDIHLCFFDTETTGLDKSRQPTQIAGLVTDIDLNVVGKFSYYIMQDYIDPGASDVSGITVDKLKEMKAIEPEQGRIVLDTIIDSYNPIFIGHNIQFDLLTVQNLYESVGKTLKVDRFPIIDTYRNAKYVVRQKTPNKKLGTLMEYSGIKDDEVTETIQTAKIIEFDNLTNYKTEFRTHDALFDSAIVYHLAKRSKMFGKI